ncbi:Probable glutathione S-transferase [Linum perenne]
MADIKLLGTWPSQWSHRVIWALKLKDLFNKSQLLLQSNPVHKKIPVLIHGGKPISESMIILQYLDDAFPESYPLMPTAPYEKAVARFWIKFAEDKLTSAFMIFRTSGEVQKKLVEETLEIIEEKAGLCENNNFFNGDEIGIVDLAFSGIGYWLGLIESSVGVKMMDSHKFPRLFSWATNFREHPVIKANTPFEL